MSATRSVWKKQPAVNAVSPLPRDAGCVEESYPMYAIPIKELLELESWVPHQELLEQGKLERIPADGTAKNVIFASHQWCSFDHPDPMGDQLKALQVRSFSSVHVQSSPVQYS